MSDYDDIKAAIEACAVCLADQRFVSGDLYFIQNEIKTMGGIMSNLNDYVKSIDDRVVALEEKEK